MGRSRGDPLLLCGAYILYSPNARSDSKVSAATLLGDVVDH